MSYCRYRLSTPTSSMIVERLLRARQEEAGNVEGVDRLDQQLDAGVLQLVGGEAQVVDERRAAAFSGRHAGGAMPARQLSCLQPSALRVVDGLADAVLEFADAVRVAGDAALAGGPVAGGQVVQHLRQAVCASSRSRELRPSDTAYGNRILDAVEAGLRGALEAVEEVDLVEEHREIGCKLRHGLVTLGERWQVGVSPAGHSAEVGASVLWLAVEASSNSMTLSISVPIAMLVTRSRMTSTTTGTLVFRHPLLRLLERRQRSPPARYTRIALQPRPSTTAR